MIFSGPYHPRRTCVGKGVGLSKTYIRYALIIAEELPTGQDRVRELGPVWAGRLD